MISFIGCSKHIEEKYPNGNIKVTGTIKSDKMIDKWVYYYENGRIKAEGNFLNGDGSDTAKVSGIPRNGRVGIWKYFEEDGKISEEVDYVSNEKFKSTSFYKSGNIEIEENYQISNRDTVLVKGTKYYDNGKKQEEIEYRNDSTFYTAYYDNEKVNEYQIYTKDKLIIQERYRKDGTYAGKLLLDNELKWLDIYYTDKVDSVEAYKIAKFYANYHWAPDKMSEEDKTWCTIDLRMGTYQYGFPVKEGIQNDESTLKSCQYLNWKCTREVLNGVKIETALCDVELNILRIVMW